MVKQEFLDLGGWADGSSYFIIIEGHKAQFMEYGNEFHCWIDGMSIYSEKYFSTVKEAVEYCREQMYICPDCGKKLDDFNDFKLYLYANRCCKDCYPKKRAYMDGIGFDKFNS